MRVSVLGPAGASHLARAYARATRVVRDPLMGRGWDVYLVASVALAPFVAPVAGTPLAWLDVVNLLALAVFWAVAIAHRLPVEWPLRLPVILAAAGSTLALVNALSLAASAYALAQDVYLYTWLAALVALLGRRGEARPARLAFVAVAMVVALACLAEWWGHGGRNPLGLLSPSGHRSSAWFRNANLCADFLVLGLFMLLGLDGRVGRRMLAASGLVLGAGLLTTKSNGALFALVAGLMAWGAMRAHAAGLSARRLAGAACLGLSLLLVPGWLVSETGLGGPWLQGIAQRTLLARVGHSSESRERIWRRLERTVARAPLGIGPGNSSAQDVAIGEREHKDTLHAKEAHSDYLGYAVERGPLGLVGLLAALGAIGARILRRRDSGGSAGASVRAACLGALVAMLVQSTVIEQLHFRHVWWFVAWMWSATAPAGAAA